MKREDVKNKITGITEEQPNWLMQENGSDITREKFLSTLSLRRATLLLRFRFFESLTTYFISIHALLAESDVMHALKLADLVLFLSTLSLRRATQIKQTCRVEISISIHALLAESDPSTHQKNPSKLAFLSTLSLRRATDKRCQFNGNNGFLSTLSLRRATAIGQLQCIHGRISIHALLAESDCSGSQQPAGTTNFYPRSPCGERQH